MEGWRSYLNEQEEIRTVGQLRAAIEKERSLKKTGKVGKGLIGVLTNATGIDLAQGLGSMIKDAYKLPDSKKTNTFLDRLNVDDEVSAIVDDAVENMFLNNAAEEFIGLPDETELDQIDITQRLADFIAKKFDQRTVSVPDNV
tara:strand:- start:23 stop:451 length:429 start_codon:yes stop_codon:yes gene_type:complete